METIKSKIRQYIKHQPAGRRLKVSFLWGELFRYRVAQGSVSRALSELKDEGIVEKTDAGGRNSRWVIL